MNKLKIAFYANGGSPMGVTPDTYWGRGTGGAETALIWIAHELAQRGHTVSVYNDANGDYDGVAYRPCREFVLDEPLDVFVLFRNPWGGVTRTNAKTKIFWSCDQYTSGNYATDVFPWVDHTIVISPYHLDYHINHYGLDPEMSWVTDLGVNWEEYRIRQVKDRFRLIYCSVPDRGLEVLHQAFPLILEQVPEAKLTITADYRLWGVNYAGDEKHRADWQNLVERGIVNYVGAVPRKELVKLQLEAEVQAYPCCLLPLTPVDTIHGPRPVNEMAAGSAVVGGNGQIERIGQVHTRHWSGTAIGIETTHNDSVAWFTPEHLIFAIKEQDIKRWKNRLRQRKTSEVRIPDPEPVWIEASKLRKGDYVAYTQYHISDLRVVKLGNWVLVPIAGTKQQEYSGPVFDLGIESEHHSFSCCDMIVHNCYEELFCLSVTECQAAGAVPVTTTLGSLPTTLGVGIRVEGDPTAPDFVPRYAHAVVDLLTDRARLRYLQTKAEKYSTVRFPWTTIAEAWENKLTEWSEAGRWQ